MKNIRSMGAIGLFLAGVAVLLNGCAATPKVEDAQDSETISTLSMTCKSPYELKQDCSSWSGATRNLIIDGYELKTAASEDGEVILVMDAHLFSNSMKDMFTLNSPTHSKASNYSYHAVKKVLDREMIQVKQVRAVTSFGNIDGYVLDLNADGYSVLKQYTRK